MNYPWIDDHFLAKKGVIKEYKEEWGCFRFMLCGKMVAMLGNDNKENEILTVKCDPAFGELLREQYADITPGYYMNKLHWNSVNVNGKSPDEILKQMIDNSYNLIFAALTKKRQAEVQSLK